ncbi:MAG: hypothetical protein U0528_10435 [Anaerolineae bacterium]|nr:hypothetical protein [Anaerolineae bacterium]
MTHTQQQGKTSQPDNKDALKKKGALETDVEPTQQSRPPIEELEELTDESAAKPTAKPINKPDDSYDPTDEITPG